MCWKTQWIHDLLNSVPSSGVIPRLRVCVDCLTLELWVPLFVPPACVINSDGVPSYEVRCWRSWNSGCCFQQVESTLHKALTVRLSAAQFRRGTLQSPNWYFFREECVWRECRQGVGCLCSVVSDSAHRLIDYSFLCPGDFPGKNTGVGCHFRGTSWPRDGTRVSCISGIGRWILYHWASWKAQEGG